MICSQKGKESFIFWITLSCVYLLFSTIFSCLAPIGSWVNVALGTYFWGEYDPTAHYVGSALHLVSAKPFIYYYSGHPGLTLQLLIFFTSKLYYACYLLIGGDEEFFAFAARNIKNIFIISKIAVTFTHILSFYILYEFTLKLLKDERAAVFSALGYATSFPVLYYLSRISTEPLIVIFFMLSIMAFWSYQERILEGELKKLLVPIILLALYSSAGFYTKIHLLGLLPIFILIGILWGSTLDGTKVPITKRLQSSGLFLLFISPLMYLMGLKINWEEFFTTWFQHIPGEHIYNEGQSVIENVLATLSRIGNISGGYVKMIQKFFTVRLPEYMTVTKNGVFTLTEFPFILIGVVGLYVFWRYNKDQRNKLLTPLLYAVLIIPIFIIRPGWHYLFISLIIISVFFGYTVSLFSEKILEKEASRNKLLIALLFLVILHFASMFTVVDSRLTDAAIYKRVTAPYYEGLGKIKPGERVAILSKEKASINTYFQIFDVYRNKIPRNSRLLIELRKLFVVVDYSTITHQKLVDTIKMKNIGAFVYEPQGLELPVMDFFKKSILQEQSELKGVQGPYMPDEIIGRFAKDKDLK